MCPGSRAQTGVHRKMRIWFRSLTQEPTKREKGREEEEEEEAKKKENKKNPKEEGEEDKVEMQPAGGGEEEEIRRVDIKPGRCGKTQMN